jgi:hypothetical protein
VLINKLRQPIAAYERLSKGELNDNAKINWPPDLIHKYQFSFVDGYALSAVWQEVPISLIIGLCDEVRNRLLRFALEIKSEAGEKPSSVPKEKLEMAVNNFIYGGVNVFGGTVGNLTQIGDISVSVGDFEALSKALFGMALPETEIDELKDAIEADHGSFGLRTKEWMIKAASFVGKGGAKAGAAIGTDVLKELLMQYFGLK